MGSINLKMEWRRLSLFVKVPWWSLVEFNLNYNELQVRFGQPQWRKPYHNDKMDAVVDILSKKGLLVESERCPSCQSWNMELNISPHRSLMVQLSISRISCSSLPVNEYQFANLSTSLVEQSYFITQSCFAGMATIGVTLYIPFGLNLQKERNICS